MSAKSGMLKAAGLIMVAMIISRILGYARDMVIYSEFGQNRLTDAYNAAFSIPDFLYLLLVGGALSSAFIPVFSSYLANNREEEAWEVASTVFNIIILLVLVGIILGYIFTPQLIYLLVPGFSPETAGLAVKLTRIMFIQVIFMALSGMSMGVLNSHQHFFAPAMGSILYNLGIILVGLILSRNYGITGFSIGVVAGSILNFVIQIPALLKKGLHYKLSINVYHPGVRRMAVLILPILISLSVTQLNLFVTQNLASNLFPGSVAALKTAYRLMHLPIGIFAVAIAVAVFPSMSSFVARGEMGQFRRSVSLGLRSIVFLNLPAAAGFIALGEPLIRLLFEHGKFTPQATQATAHALLFYSFGIFAYASLHVLNRSFYAIQDTRTPMFVGLLSITANIFLSYTLVKVMNHVGLALAYSLAGMFNMMLLVYFLRRKTGPMGGKLMMTSFVKSLVASLVMGAVVFATAEYTEQIVDLSFKWAQGLQVGLAVGVGIAVYTLLVIVLKIDEARTVLEVARKRFRRQ